MIEVNSQLHHLEGLLRDGKHRLTEDGPLPAADLEPRLHICVGDNITVDRRQRLFCTITCKGRVTAAV